MSSDIRYFNRKTQKIEIEKVYGDQAVKWAYQNPFGFLMTKLFLARKPLSAAMGWYQDTHQSTKAIPTFVEQYEIPLKDYEEQDYKTFNEFFIRKFKPGLRPFDPSKTVFSAGAEARYLAVENLKAETRFPVKGIEINLEKLFHSKALAKDFMGGTLIIARLCPVDYHRFHFPISGSVTSQETLHGAYHSVNPVALSALPNVLFKNERQVAIIENEEFGKVAMIEVGAMGVGKIVQSAYSEKRQFPVKFDKGQEKGYFLFGGSTVIWVLQAGKLRLSPDLSRNSNEGIETWIPLGDALGERTEGASSSSTTNH